MARARWVVILSFLFALVAAGSAAAAKDKGQGKAGADKPESVGAD